MSLCSECAAWYHDTCLLSSPIKLIWQEFQKTIKKRKWGHSVMSDSLQNHGLLPTRLLHPWDFSAKNTGVGCHFLLQGIFPDQNLCLLHWQLDSLPLRHQGNPFWNLIAFKNSYSSEKQLYGNIKINTKGFQRTYYTGAEVFVKMLYIFYLHTPLTYSFSYFELVCCSMSHSNCCFLTCIVFSRGR